MAEIKIEKKQPIWPWLLAALVVLAVLAYLFVYNNDNDDGLAENEQETAGLVDGTNVRDNDSPDPAVASYVQYVKNDPDKMGLDHNYANEALTRLMEATQAKADQIGYDAATDLNQVKEYADKIATDPFETTHANSIRKATDLLTTTLDKNAASAVSTTERRSERAPAGLGGHRSRSADTGSEAGGQVVFRQSLGCFARNELIFLTKK